MFYILTSLIAFIIGYFLCKFITDINSDYKVIWTARGKWEMYEYNVHIYNEYCSYEILYSEKDNSYIINCSGYKPKKHHMYEKVVQKYNEFVKNSKKT